MTNQTGDHKKEKIPRSKSAMWQRVTEFETQISTSSGKRAKVLLFLLRVAKQVVLRWSRDRCPQQAASLAFQTVLSIVPLTAVALASLRATGMMQESSSFVNFVAKHFVPVSPQKIAETLSQFSEHITFQSMGLWGLITTVFIGFVMYLSLEKILGHIWRVGKGRSLGQTFIVFYATITIGPLLLTFSLVQAARFGFDAGWLGFILSLLTTFIGLFLANYFLPAAKVRVVPALIGTVVTTILFEVAKYGFQFYVGRFALAQYAGVYGAFSVFPIWLIWIYWSWLMLLLGSEIAYVIQHLDILSQHDHKGWRPLHAELLEVLTGPLALRFMTMVAKNFAKAGKPSSVSDLREAFDLSEEAAEKLIARLKDGGLLLSVARPGSGVVPARPLSQISVENVFAVFAPSAARVTSKETAVDRVLSRMHATSKKTTESTTLADLVDDNAEL